MLTSAFLLLGVCLSAAADEVGEERRLADLVLDRLLEGQARVQRIVDPMRIAGSSLCGKKLTPVLGVYAPSLSSFSDFFETYYRDSVAEPVVDAARERWELGKYPKVLHVVPGLPADRAGLEAGDLITAVDGRKVRRRLRLAKWKGSRTGEPILRLSVDRNGVSRDLEVEVEMGCAIASRFRFDSQWNAISSLRGDLSGIHINEGLLRAQADDAAVAVAVGHEFAHYFESHVVSRLGVSERYEAEADYLGLYFTARAGYDIAVAPEVWEERIRENPYATIDRGFYGHPQSAKRSVELAATVKEIVEKQSQGAPLVPNRDRFGMDRPPVDGGAASHREAALREEALERYRTDQKRIVDVAYRLAVAGAPICDEEVAPLLGAIIARGSDFGRSQKKQTELVFGASDEITVFAVAEDSPAKRAGLVPRDQILAVDGSKPDQARDVFDQLRKAGSEEPLLRIRRGEEVFDVALPRTIGCPYGLFVAPSGGIDTDRFRNNKEMLIPTGLLRFVEDDDELAIALSHQIGHQILQSFRTAKNEPRADELGLQIASLAGFDVSKAPAYWDRWASLQFWTITSDTGGQTIQHGGMSRRASAIRKSVTELHPATEPASSTDSRQP